MSREVKDYDIRKKEILDVAQDLFFTKGYDITSVEDIITKVGIAKGTFYHYFKSKGELLDVLIDRVLERAESIYRATVEDSCLNAIEKLERIGNSIEYWKSTVPEMKMVGELFSSKVIAIELWHNLRKKSITRLSPIVEKIVVQGKEEGLFKVEGTDCIGEIIMQIVFDLKEGMSLEQKSVIDPRDLKLMIMKKTSAYISVIEAVLGLPQKSLRVGSRL